MPREDEFKFPDEVENKATPAPEDDPVEVEFAADDVEVEIVDDTPAKDRNRKPLDKEVEDPTDDEIEKYSDKVQARIKELTHARHDERRLKEETLREKQELEKFARYLADENKKLKQTVNTGQEAFISTATREAEAQLEHARRKYKDAQEAYDTDAIIAAQEEFTEAKMRLLQVKNYKPTPLQEEETEVQLQYGAQAQPQQVQPDEKSLRWQAKNQWYGQPGFEEYTSYALGLHHKLVNSGTDPRSDDYFARIDERMKSTFPELFGGNDATKPEPDTPVAKKPAAVVAPASRSTGKQKITLTPRQLALAKKFGLTPLQYATAVAKEEKRNG